MDRRAMRKMLSENEKRIYDCDYSAARLDGGGDDNDDDADIVVVVVATK